MDGKNHLKDRLRGYLSEDIFRLKTELNRQMTHTSKRNSKIFLNTKKKDLIGNRLQIVQY